MKWLRSHRRQYGSMIWSQFLVWSAVVLLSTALLVFSPQSAWWAARLFRPVKPVLDAWGVLVMLGLIVQYLIVDLVEEEVK